MYLRGGDNKDNDSANIFLDVERSVGTYSPFSLGLLLRLNCHLFYDWKVIVVWFLSIGKMSCVIGYKVVHNFLKQSSFLKLRWFALLFKFLLSKY